MPGGRKGWLIQYLMLPANSYWYDNKTLIQIITDGQPVSFRQLRGFAAGVRYRFHTGRLQ